MGRESFSSSVTGVEPLFWVTTNPESRLLCMGVPKPAEYEVLEPGRSPALPVDSSSRTGPSLVAGATTRTAVEHNELPGRNDSGYRSVAEPAERRGAESGGSAGSTSMTQPST